LPGNRGMCGTDRTGLLRAASAGDGPASPAGPFGMRHGRRHG
jgi:hypothetical protein